MNLVEAEYPHGPRRAAASAPADVAGHPGSHPLIDRLARAGQRLRQADQRLPWVLDTALVAVVALLFCAADVVHRDHPPAPAYAFTMLPLWGMLALQAGLVLPLLARRRAPAVVFVVIAAVFFAQWALGAALRADVALLIALYNLALRGRLRHLAWACAVTVGALAVVVVRVSDAVSDGDAVFFLSSTVVAAVALGLAMRVRRAQLAVLRERADRLEIERDQRVKLAEAAERARMAREMHDIVGHNLSVIVTLADGGLYAAGRAPDRGAQALRLIGDTGRQALGELRRLLGVLREQAASPELSPQPAMADIDALCRRIGAAGPHVVYRSAVDAGALDRGVQLAAYRVVQEALTNVLKHAGPDTRVLLTFALQGRWLRLRVHDTGPPRGTGRRTAAPPGQGHGLVGMRERAALYGGTVTAGAAADGGWTVEAAFDLTPLPVTGGVS